VPPRAAPRSFAVLRVVHSTRRANQPSERVIGGSLGSLATGIAGSEGRCYQGGGNSGPHLDYRKKENAVLTLTRTLNDLVEDLHIRGYTLIRAEPEPGAITAAAGALGTHLGARWMGSRTLEAKSDPTWLPRHTEQLDDQEPLRFFALGCLTSATEGGATCLFDGRAAARTLLAQQHGFTSVRITYATKWRPTKATHLLIDQGAHGPTLRFRSKLETNSVVGLPADLSEDEMYGLVESALTEAVVLVHQWRAGDLRVVNNRAMIHARQPFNGTRRMIRFRYDDPHYQTVTLNP
jgi:hypothetical protein